MNPAMEVYMTRRKLMLVAVLGLGVVGLGALGLAVLGEGPNIWAEDDEDENQDALVKAFGRAKVGLQQGLTASEQEGQPISGKFEAEEGQFQLSIYTEKGGKFSEVLVDYTTGKVAKVEPITKPDDVAEATSQSAAMAKAKIPLREAVEKAASEAPDFRPVSVTPDLRDGHAVASVVLLKGEEFKKIEKSLE